jgi:hypothetical protein
MTDEHETCGYSDGRRILAYSSDQRRLGEIDVRTSADAETCGRLIVIIIRLAAI